MGELLGLARLTSSGEANHEGGEVIGRECDVVISHGFSFPPSGFYLHFYLNCAQVLDGETGLKKVHEDLMLPKIGPRE